jgi:NAD(P)-dependent dehydrogenase (short-subunit alcohol dehydrogenase family)
MNLELSGKTALISGASAGIGASIARKMAAEGVNLILVARTESKLEGVRASILASLSGEVPDIEIACCDLSDSKAIDLLASRFSHIDILVNNAGAVPAGDMFEVDEERWRAGWDSKVFPYIHMCRRYYPLLKANGGGVIVNILGNGSLLMTFEYICGGMGNAALDFFTRTVGAHSPADNIRVLGVSPGPVNTERYQKIAESRMARSGVARKTPFDRIATPEEVAEMVTFLASPRCAYVSGSIHVIDGGLSVAKQETGV